MAGIRGAFDTGNPFIFQHAVKQRHGQVKACQLRNIVDKEWKICGLCYLCPVLVNTFLPQVIVDTGYSRGGGSTGLLCMGCKHDGVSCGRASHMYDHRQVVSGFIHNSFHKLHAFFIVKKETFPCTSADIKTFDSLVYVIAGKLFGCSKIQVA